MAIALGLTAALALGTADFVARHATRTVGSYRTLLFMQLFGLAGLSVYVVVSGELGHFLARTSWQPWAWAGLVAVITTADILALYRAYETGDLSITAPVASSFPVFTVVLAVLSGERIGAVRALVIVLVLAGVLLACYAPTPEHGPPPGQVGPLAQGVGWAILSSLGAGLALWIMGFKVTPYLGAAIPVWLGRLIGPVLMALVARPMGQTISVPAGTIWWLLGIVGVLDTGGFLSATRGLESGQVAIVSVLVSLFSAVTILLARVFLNEELRRSQWAGVLIILFGVALINAHS